MAGSRCILIVPLIPLHPQVPLVPRYPQRERARERRRENERDRVGGRKEFLAPPEVRLLGLIQVESERQMEKEGVRTVSGRARLGREQKSFM